MSYTRGPDKHAGPGKFFGYVGACLVILMLIAPWFALAAFHVLDLWFTYASWVLHK
jgi:hypothetical protein